MNDRFPLAAPIMFGKKYANNVLIAAADIVEMCDQIFVLEGLVLDMFCDELKLGKNDRIEWDDACPNDRYVLPYKLIINTD